MINILKYKSYFNICQLIIVDMFLNKFLIIRINSFKYFSYSQNIII